MLPTDTIKHRLIKDVEFLRAPEGYIRAGYPGYHTLYGRDSLIIAWQLLSYDPTIASNTLRVLATFQGTTENAEHEEEPGKILHEWWGDIGSKTPLVKPGIPWPFPYYGSIDSTFLFIIVAALYLEQTGDQAFITSLGSNILAAVAWMEKYADPDHDHFVEYARKNPRGLFHQGWRDSPQSPHESAVPPFESVEIQGYKYRALTTAPSLLTVLDQTEPIDRLQKEAAILQQLFAKHYWWEAEQYFYCLRDGNNIPLPTVTSNPGHLLGTGILTAAQATVVTHRLWRDDLWTPYGIRTESTLNPDFNPTSYHHGSIWPHDNWIIASGMRRHGDEAGYQKIKAALLAAYNELGSLPELYAVDTHHRFVVPPVSNSVQGWATAGLLNMLLRQ